MEPFLYATWKIHLREGKDHRHNGFSGCRCPLPHVEPNSHLALCVVLAKRSHSAFGADFKGI